MTEGSFVNQRMPPAARYPKRGPVGWAAGIIRAAAAGLGSKTGLQESMRETGNYRNFALFVSIICACSLLEGEHDNFNLVNVVSRWN